ncbi:MAG TPA: metallophosphoesterase family protein [Casimicrobiaceae bacterium]|nr:metallophosphoesterase family protein [Casimicrobiaceae bacterium]
MHVARPPAVRIGLISDTHGLLRPEALSALRGSDMIVHAGDIGDPSILEQLAAIAPVCAVRGNNDVDPPVAGLPPTRRVDTGGKRIFVLHDLVKLAVEPLAAGIDVIVSGHSHKPKIERRDGVLYVNPGSAGPRRFRLPISVGRLTIAADRIEAELLPLDIGAAPAALRRAAARGSR